MTFQEAKMQILTNLACENFNRGGLNDDSRMDESVAEASQAIDELVKKMVIGEDVEPHRLVNDRLSMSGDVENERNILRASQRQVIDKEKSDEQNC